MQGQGHISITTVSRPPFTLDDLVAQLHRLADDPKTPDPLLPKEEGRTEQVRALARRWGMRRDDLYQELRAIRQSRLQVTRDVVLGDLERDPLVRSYAEAAIDVANTCLAETMKPLQRDLLTSMAATATMVYAAWTPTIHAEGDDYMAVKRSLSSTSHVSWHDAYPFAPITILNARPSRRTRTPLMQFMIWWRLRVTNRDWEERWGELRTVECQHDWSDFVYTDRVAKRTWDHWMSGDTWIPSTFLLDAGINR